jgi:uncharacterized protein YjiS (DUF1127 family)
MESSMTEIVVHLSNSAFGHARFAARLMRSLQRALIALSARHALDALPDGLLRDIGLKRCDIRFVAVALASGEPPINMLATHSPESRTIAACQALFMSSAVARRTAP